MFKIHGVLLTLFCLLCHSMYAQERIVTGTVSDENGEKLVGATVMLHGSSIGVLTDERGTYRLSVPAGKNQTLQYSYIGMQTQQRQYRGESVIDVVLPTDKQMLATVEVCANPNINDIDVRARTGVIQSIDMKRVDQRPMISLGLALQGTAAGLSVINTGELGTAPEIRIRGNASLRRGNTVNEPLYVLDGKVINPETFYNLNASDIESVKVLKDATACALYGTKAANGVLEIKSKRGREGRPHIQYSFNMGITTKGRRGIKMMDTDEKLEIERQMQNPEAPGYRWSRDFYERYHAGAADFDALVAEGAQKLEALRRIHTDWFDVLLRNSLYQNHNLSIRGGGSGVGYFLSADYAEQGGMLPGNNKQRMGMMLNLDFALGQMGYFMLNTSLSHSRTHTPTGSSLDPATLIYELNPYETPDGELVSYPGRTLSDLLNQYQQQSDDKNAGLSLSLQLSPIPGLDIGAVAGLDYTLASSTRFVPSTAWEETQRGIPEEQRGMIGKNKAATLNASLNIRSTYHRIFADKHDITLGANTDYYFYDYDEVGITGYGVGEIRSAAAINQSITGNRQARVYAPRDRNAQFGVGLLAAYTYAGTYDLYATMKWDASSVLPEAHRWNKAWAVGWGWTLSKYTWWHKQKWLSDLRLKGSYGRMANTNGLSISQTIGTFAYSEKRYENQRLLEFQGIYNDKLVPEQMVSTDIGLQLSVLKRFDIGINLYHRRTEQALLDVPIPSSAGYKVLRRNIGVLLNKGVEFTLDSRLIETEKWGVSIGANMAWNKNMVEDLYYTKEIFVSESSLVPDYKVGEAYDMIWGAKAIAINPLTGYPVFETPSGEKQASQTLLREDIVALGHATPPITGGWSVSAHWKNIELNADFYFALGGKKVFNYRYVRNKDGIIKNAIAGQLNAMWLHTGDENKIFPTPFYTSATAEQNIYLYPNSMRVGKSDFMRLSMLSARYKVNARWLEKHVGVLKYASFGIQASNLFTWTAYNEADPESSLGKSLQPVITINCNLTF